MSTLERAIALAARAHEGQLDKAGAPYVLHPLRMMLRMKTLEERIVATLHDVVEDCGVTFDHLRTEGFSEAVIDGVDSVTRRETETYEEFILRSKENVIGTRVKLADLEDNSDISRLREVTERDRARLEKYQRAIAVLTT
jgi:(p)ppGpp synthase/HD superfamily hydrolase